jgi:two-component sensor histidine kinase
MVNILSDDTTIFKGRVGFSFEFSVPREHSVCSITVDSREYLCIPDLAIDSRTKALPYIGTSPFYRFYAGVPLIGSNGFSYGTICAADFSARPEGLTSQQVECMRALGRQVVRMIEARDFTQRQSILKNELAHRMKNMFSLIQSIVGSTLRSCSDINTAKEDMYARFQALSRANDVLIKGSNSTSVAEVVSGAICVQGGAAGQFTYSGPNVTLNARSTVSLSMILHELITNASKYGALSDEFGHVSIEWSHDDSTFELVWREMDGPPITDHVGRKGFGTTLTGMGMSVPGSEGISTYDEAGLVYTLKAPCCLIKPSA